VLVIFDFRCFLRIVAVELFLPDHIANDRPMRRAGKHSCESEISFLTRICFISISVVSGKNAVATAASDKRSAGDRSTSSVLSVSLGEHGRRWL